MLIGAKLHPLNSYEDPAGSMDTATFDFVAPGVRSQLPEGIFPGMDSDRAFVAVSGPGDQKGFALAGSCALTY